MYASSEFAELATWARSVVDEVAGDGMEAAFEASCAHEVAFWESAFNGGGAAPVRRLGAA